MQPLAEQRRLREKEIVIKRLLQLEEENDGRLPRFELRAAAQELAVSPRSINYWLDRYKRYQVLYPDEPAVNALINLSSGRPAGQMLTEKQQQVAVGAYLERKRTAALPTGRETVILTRPDIAYVHRVLTAAFPDQPVSEATIRRFLAKERKKNPALFVLARDGESALWRDYIPKTTNDVSAPNERWQSDGRYLPIYVQYEGRPSRVALVSILDDKSRYVPAWCLVPRQEQDELGDLHTVDFTGEHVRMLFASAMYKTQIRPRAIYTDNGSQFKALEPRMKYLTDEAEPPIEIVHTKPGRPQGRGKMERALGQIDTFLHGLPGYVEDEDDAMCWKRAREAANLLSLEELELNLKKHFEYWNTVSQNGKPSRFQVWQLSTVSLPAPTLIRLALLADASEITDASVTDDGIRYKNKYYMIIPKGPEDYQRWTKLVGQKVPLCAIPMEKETLIVVALDGKKWEPVVPIAVGRPSKQKHNHFQQAVIKQLKGELAVVREQFRTVIVDVCGGMPKLDALTHEVFFGDRTAPTDDEHDMPPQPNDESLTNSPAEGAEDASQGMTQASSPPAEAAAPPAVVDRAPGLAQVPSMAELMQAIKDQRSSKGNKQ